MLRVYPTVQRENQQSAMACLLAEAYLPVGAPVAKSKVVDFELIKDGWLRWSVLVE